MNKNQIGLVDCNNFFVSCERLFRPDLMKKPVMVLSSNDGCVVARSQEVKDMNIPMGVPYFSIKDIIKKQGITVFSSHLALYRDISRRVFAVMKEEIERVEEYSIDEAFFAVEGNADLVASSLKKVIEKRVGIPVSVGIAANKTQAKYANNLAKKGSGVCCLSQADWQNLLTEIKLRDLWGVGGKLADKFAENNLINAADFLNLDPSRLERLFGKVGMELRNDLLGAHSPLKPKTEPQKSIMSSRSFRNESSEKIVMTDAVAYHVRHVAKELRRKHLKSSLIRVSIRPSRYGDFVLKGGAAEHFLSVPTNDTFELMKVAMELLNSLFEANVPYKKVGVTLGDLVSDDTEQMQLFNTNLTTSAETLMREIDFLNNKAGKELVVLGAGLKKDSWQSRSSLRSPAYTTNWTQLPTAKS